MKSSLCMAGAVVALAGCCSPQGELRRIDNVLESLTIQEEIIREYTSPLESPAMATLAREIADFITYLKVRRKILTGQSLCEETEKVLGIDQALRERK